MDETHSIFPLEIGDVTLTGWDGFSYVAEDGRTYRSALAEPTAEDAAACVASPAPEPAGVVSRMPLQVLTLLTAEEEAALAASTDLAVTVVRNRLLAASEIRSDDPRTAQGAALLVAKGIITAERAGEIFSL